MNKARRTISIFTNYASAVFQRDVIAGAREVFDNSGYQVAVIEITQPPTQISDIPLDERRLAGALVITGVLPDHILEALHEREIPLSLVSHQVPGGHIPGVMPNNRQGIAMLVEHLVVTHKRRKPVFIQGYMTQSDGLQRSLA